MSHSSVIQCSTFEMQYAPAPVSSLLASCPSLVRPTGLCFVLWQAAVIGTCIRVPVEQCGQLYGPCAAVAYGNTKGSDVSVGASDIFCPSTTTCPTGYAIYFKVP